MGRAEGAAEMWVRNPFMRIRLDTPLVCDLLLENVSYEASSPMLMKVLSVLARPGTLDELAEAVGRGCGVTRAEAEATLEELIRHRIVVMDGEWAAEMEAVRHWERRGWLDAAVLHLRSRSLPYEDISSKGDRPGLVRRLAAALTEEAEPPPEWESRSGIAPPIELGSSEPFPSEETLEQVLLRRRSGGRWRGGPMSLPLLSAILRYPNLESANNRSLTEEGRALQPERLFFNSSYLALETTLFVFNVDGVAPGIYFYDIRQHSLVPLKYGDFRSAYGKMCIGQHWFAGGAVAVLISAIWHKYMYRYRHARGYRNLFINVAQLAHKYVIVATAHGLTNYITPALNDDLAAELIGTEPLHESPLYTVALG